MSFMYGPTDDPTVIPTPVVTEMAQVKANGSHNRSKVINLEKGGVGRGKVDKGWRDMRG